MNNIKIKINHKFLSLLLSFSSYSMRTFLISPSLYSAVIFACLTELVELELTELFSNSSLWLIIELLMKLQLSLKLLPGNSYELFAFLNLLFHLYD